MVQEVEDTFARNIKYKCHRSTQKEVVTIFEHKVQVCKFNLFNAVILSFHEFLFAFLPDE